MEEKTEPVVVVTTCEDCGKQGPTVEATTCPFAEEVHGEIVPIVVCGACYLSRLEDI